MERKTRVKLKIMPVCVICCLLTVLVMRAEAQIAIKETVTDEDQHPVPTANVLLLNPSDSSMVKGGVTDESGRFQLQRIMPGSYMLSVSMIGYQTHTTEPFKVAGNPVQMDPVTLLQSVKQLDAVNVRAGSSEEQSRVNAN